MTAALRGDAVLRSCFGRTLEAEEKSHLGDVRTPADTASERAILDVIERAYPRLAILSEECGRRGTSRHVVVIDPLDGSDNFVLGVPDFSVSLALMCEEETVIGVIHQPVLRRTYWALKGRGAYLDGARLHVSHESRVEQATVSYTSGYLAPPGQSEHVAHAFAPCA